MDNTSGANYNINQLWSADGILRNSDSITDSGNAFAGGDLYSATGGDRPEFELRNPSGSGIVVLVDQILVTSQATTPYITIGSMGTAIGAGTTALYNLKIGESASSAKITTRGVSIPSGDSWFSVNAQQNTPLYLRYPYPIYISAGQAIFVYENTADTILTASFLIREFTP